MRIKQLMEPIEAKEPIKALCETCVTEEECAICFLHLCAGDIQKGVTVCNKCLTAHPETNDSGERIHPVSRKPLLMCICGGPFIGECRYLAIFSKTGNSYEIDTSWLEQCKTPQERRALLTDPTARKKMEPKHWPVSLPRD
jgi:hypothetical protein